MASPEPPTPRRGETLPDDHPLAWDASAPVPVAARWSEPTAGDCISDVPADVLEDVAAWHDGDDPPTTEVDPGELV